MSCTPAPRAHPMTTLNPPLSRSWIEQCGWRPVTPRTLGTNADGRHDDARHRKGERAPRRAQGHRSSSARDPSAERAPERRIDAPSTRKCGWEALARSARPPTRDEQREAIARHKAKCRMPGMRLAPRMRGEWSEEIRADSECRRCATRQKGSRRWWEQGGTAHTGRPARSSRARRCAAQGSPSGSATKRYESATTHSPLPPLPCESGYRKIRVACRVSRWDDGAPEGPRCPLAPLWCCQVRREAPRKSPDAQT